MVRRVCLFGGPGSGKSTLSHRLVGELKARHHDVEHIAEYVKKMAYEGRKPQGNDQLYIYSNQQELEEMALRHVQTVVTDSPVLLAAAYAKLYDYKRADFLAELACDFEEQYPSTSFYLERTVPYVEKGRFQTYGEAVDFDTFLLTFLKRHYGHMGLPLHVVRVDELDEIIGTIEGAKDGR